MSSNQPASQTIAAVTIGLGAVASILLMARHPTTGARDPADVVGEIVAESATTRFVHGALIVVMWAVFLGLVELAGRLGWRRARVRGGAIVYGAGVAAMTGAALVSGFVVPDLAGRYAGSPAPELEGIAPLLRLCFASNQALAAAGVTAMSAGIVLWSTAMLSLASRARPVGLLGLIVGALPVLGLLTGRLRLHLHGMGAVIVAQALWSVAVSAWMLLDDRRSEPRPD